jgi:hypothetical protein
MDPTLDEFARTEQRAATQRKAALPSLGVAVPGPAAIANSGPNLALRCWLGASMVVTGWGAMEIRSGSWNGLKIQQHRMQATVPEPGS